MTAQREFQRTHPWISFRLVLDDLGSLTWMLLGEARSKCAHISNVPLAPETAHEMHLLYFAKGISATTRIEGNTLSEDQVRERMEGELPLPPSKEYLGIEVDNMLAVYNEVMHSAAVGSAMALTPDTLRELNRRILSGLALEPGVVPGEFRTYAVAVGPYRGAPARDCEYLVNRLCSWLETFKPPDPQLKVPVAIITAVTAHVYLEWIHPFGDGNGRLGRLVEFMIMANAGIPAPAAHLLTTHYNETRSEYYRQLNGATERQDVLPFLRYAVQGFVDQLATQIERLHRQQEQLMWRSVVDQYYQGRPAATSSRQRSLALELGRIGRWVPRSELMTLNDYLRDAYASKTPKTLTRDLNELQKRGYIERGPAGVRAQMELVHGMRPEAAPGSAAAEGLSSRPPVGG